jgi:multidrug resistance efflux pump
MRRQRGRRCRIRKAWTWPQRVGGVLIASVCVISAVWYVPHVMSTDRRLLTGTVVSSGVITLNFANAGEIRQLNVRLGQTVRKGQVLAAEYAPNTDSVLAAQRAAIASDKAKITSLRAAVPDATVLDSAQLSAGNAQLALDEAQLMTDRVKAASTEIIAPSSGTVVGANGQSGEMVTSSGIRDYVADSQQPPATQRPEFSLFPEGPQPVRRASASGSTLPVIALRTSTTWQVVALIPESTISRIKPRQIVTIGVPAAHIKDVRGKIAAVLPTPIPTSAGTLYQALVSITGRATNLPLSGMAADIQLGS